MSFWKSMSMAESKRWFPWTLHHLSSLRLRYCCPGGQRGDWSQEYPIIHTAIISWNHASLFVKEADHWSQGNKYRDYNRFKHDNQYVVQNHFAVCIIYSVLYDTDLSFSNQFPWLQIIVFWLKFHWHSLLAVHWQFVRTGFATGFAQNRKHYPK